MVLSTEDLRQYTDWLDEEVVISWMKCAEFLIYKYSCKEIIIKHKKLADGDEEEFLVEIQTRNVDISKVTNTIQEDVIVEDAGIAMGLLVTLWLRPWKKFWVLKKGAGYDYRYLPQDSEEEEYIEVTGTEIPNGGRERLNQKIRKFRKMHPGLSGYISVSCFYDKLQIHWGYRNDACGYE